MFKGIYTALITPFLKSGSIDYNSLIKLLEKQNESRVSGVVILGTTAEECTLTSQECECVLALACKVLNNKQIIVGVSGNCTAKMIEKINIYSKYPIHGFLIGSPYYNKPSQSGLYKHFKQIALSTNLPIILYNIPGRCGISISLDVFKRLQEFSNIVAIKEASGNADYFTQLIAQLGDRYNILCGNDNILFPMLCCGASGGITVVGNIYPHIACFLYENHNKNLQKCTFLHNKCINFINSLFLETNPMCVKYVLYKHGLCKNYLRSPLCEVEKKTKRQIDCMIKELILNDYLQTLDVLQ